MKILFVFISSLIFSLNVSSQTLLINEVDSDQGTVDRAEFIELYDGGTGYTSLDQWLILVADGQDDNIDAVYDLSGYETNSGGFFLLAGSQLAAASGNSYTLPNDALPDRATLIVIYQKPLVENTLSTLESSQILDAVVYGLDNPDDDTLLSFLAQDQPQLNENEFGQKEAHSCQRLPHAEALALHTDSMMAGLVTPGQPNFSVLLINEVDASTVLQDMEFIELYDGGLGLQPLDGLVVTFYDGDTGNRYGPVLDLAGMTTDENGFFLIGNSDVPQVDLVIDSALVQDGADGLALSVGTASDYSGNDILTDCLVDGLVYHTNDILFQSSPLFDLVKENQQMVNEDAYDGKYIHSMQRFPDMAGGNMVTGDYVICKPTPKSSNHATPLINEIDFDQGVLDNREFIELYDQGRGNTPLDGYLLVLYDGETAASCHTFDLSGYQTDENGFFLLASTGVMEADIYFSNNYLKDGVHAVALFQGDPALFPDGTPVQTNGLEDAVVYSLVDEAHPWEAALLPLLLDGQQKVNEGGLGQADHHSLQRYADGNGGPRTTDFIQPALPTPGLPNSVRANQLVINEIDVDQGASDHMEFLEIYDGGEGFTSLDGLLLVLYNGVSNASYFTLDLNGYQTDENGYFLIANQAVAAEFQIQIDIEIPSETFQDGPDAAVLYLGRAENFPNGTQIQTHHIEDAVVYHTDDTSDPELMLLLNPGESYVNESGRGSSAVHSLQRFPNGSGGNQNNSTFAAALPTPDGPNMEGMIINEVDSDTPGTDAREFVELFDGGRGHSSLDGLSLVFYDGSSDEPYMVVDLDGYQTNADGYFVLGNAGVIPAVDYEIPDNTIQDGADAVALYSADEEDFSLNRAIVTTGLLDAVVYDTNDADDSGLLSLLKSNQEQLNEDGRGNKDAHSLQRSPNGTGGLRNTSTFIQAVATPSAANISWSYSTRFTDLNNPGNPGDLNTEEDDAIEGWIEITTSGQMTNSWSSPREIGFDFVFFGKSVTEFKVSQNGLLTFATADDTLPEDDQDNIDLNDQDVFNPILPNHTICAFWDSFTDAPPTNSNDKVYIKTFGTEPNRQLWIKWSSFEYGSPNSVYNYFGIVLEESSNIVYIMDYNWHSETPVSSTVAAYSNPYHFVQYEPESGLPDDISFLEGNQRSADKRDNDYYEFFPTSNVVDIEVSMDRVNPLPPQDINVGSRVTYQVSATNTGQHGATDVVLHVDFSEKLTYFSHASEGRPFDPFTGYWQAGFIPPGQTVVLEIQVDVNNSQALVNTVEVIEMNGFDIDSVVNNHELGEDDQVELYEMVPDAADLDLTISANKLVAAVDTEVQITLDLTNNGPDPADVSCIRLDIPLGLEYVSDTGLGTYQDGVWSPGVLGVGASTALNVVVRVTGHNNQPDYSINVLTQVCSMNQHDPYTINNLDVVVIYYRRTIWESTAVTGEVQVNTFTPGIQAFPSVDMSSGSAYTVSWQSESGQDGDLSGVYSRRYNYPVTSVSGEVLVNYHTQNHQRYSQTALTPDGNAVIVWQDEGQNGQWEGIFGMQFDDQGNLVLPGQYQLHHFNASTHSKPDIALDSLGNQIAVWESLGQDGDGAGVYGRLFDSSNQPVSDEFLISNTTAWDQKNPKVACDAQGNFAVVWQSWREDSGWDIMARQFSSAGTPLAPEFQVNKLQAGDQQHPDLAMSPQGDFVIVWQGPLEETQFGIFGRIYPPDGSANYEPFQINTYSAQLVAYPRVDMDDSANFVVVWYSLGQDGSGAGVFAQQFKKGAVPEGYEFKVNLTTVEDQSFPDVALNSVGEFVITWQSYLQDGDDEGVFLRAYEPPCEPLRDPSVWPQLSILELLPCVLN